MKRRWSIALRLVLWLSLGTCVFWGAAAAISTTVLRSELEQSFDESLRQSAFRLLPLARRELGQDPGRREPIPRMEFGPRPLDIGRRGPGPNGIGSNQEAFTYLVYDASGTILVRAEDAPEALPTLPMEEGYLTVEGHRAFAFADRRSDLSILMIETSDARRQALWDAVAGLFWPLAALIPLLALGIWLAVRLAMRPVERLSQDIALRNSANLAPLVDEGQPAELAPIVREVAALLDRLRSAMEAERAFAASSAHELRTPIAGALAQTQRLGAELGPHPSASRVKDVEQSLRSLSDLAEKLLQLSRLEAGFARFDEPVDLAPVLRLVVRDFQSSQAAADRVELAIDAGAELVHKINPDAFAIAVGNLIRNALLHGASHGPIEVTAGPGPVVRVCNHGAVVEGDILARLGERFSRGPTRANGTGLGLAVVDAILTQTGGRLVLNSPVPGWGDGFEAVMYLA